MPENNRAEQIQQTPQAQQTKQQSANSETHRKKHGKKWREIHPRSLLRAMGAHDSVSEDKVRALAETEYTDPVISLYIALSSGKVAPEPRGLLRSFHFMKTRAFEEHKDFIDSLSKSQKATLEHDIQEIQAFLADYFVPQHLRSLIIFRSGEKLNEVIGLLVPTNVPLRSIPILTSRRWKPSWRTTKESYSSSARRTIQNFCATNSVVASIKART